MQEIKAPKEAHTPGHTSISIPKPLSAPASDIKQEQFDTSMGVSVGFGAALSYSIGWISGIIILLFEKNTYVRFHAFQSLFLFAPLFIIMLLLQNIFGVILGWCLLLIQLLIALYLIYQAYLGAETLQRYKIPLLGIFAHKMAGK